MAGSESVRMTNADFRKILMTPKGSGPATLGTLSSTTSSTSHHNDKKSKFRPQRKKAPPPPKFDDDGVPPTAPPDTPYRDRAKERRERTNQDHDDFIMLAATAGYKAVAPDFQSGLDAAEKRRKVIEESKYLGGDLEHTHLVKGLDYALLQKVRTELSSKDESQDRTADDEESAKPKKSRDLLHKKPAVKAEESEKAVEFHSRVAKSVYNTVFNTVYPQRNQLFLPGRMAFLWDLDDEFGNWETPTTILRSKAELRLEDGKDQHADHDIVIEKLTQILSHMRQGIRTSKKVKKDKKNEFSDVRNLQAPKKPDGESIYDDDDGDYKPTTAKLFVRPGESSVSYFKKPEGVPVVDRPDGQKKVGEYIQSVIGAAKKLDMKEVEHGGSTLEKKKSAGMEANRLRVESGPDSYAECYPGFEQAMDAAVDSDDEDDLSKMDHGNNKSQIGRKAFTSEEDYSNYMAQREALPKAAFQYGVKMTDGRKKKSSNKSEKAKINSEWSKISAIIQKRKDGHQDNSDAKRSKVE